jgi:hypothetical protein
MSKGVMEVFRMINTSFISIVQFNKKPYDTTSKFHLQNDRLHSTYFGYSAILRGVKKILTGIKFISDGFLLNSMYEWYNGNNDSWVIFIAIALMASCINLLLFL